MVSVLFSEPKIPQFSGARRDGGAGCGVSVLFSEPKIPQLMSMRSSSTRSSSFSALQRAENSSIKASRIYIRLRNAFQCSSASRKFLNPQIQDTEGNEHEFQCSSASRKFLNQNQAYVAGGAPDVSVLFSEPKIPQYDSDRDSTLQAD